MIRVNIVLILILTACALSLVTSQHKARKFFVELEQERERAKQLAIEWDQLQLEQSTWATHVRIEGIAASKLNMLVPEAAEVRIIPLNNPVASYSAARPAP
jgi:cell division protein FtsL